MQVSIHISSSIKSKVTYSKCDLSTPERVATNRVEFVRICNYWGEIDVKRMPRRGKGAVLSLSDSTASSYQPGAGKGG